MAKDTAALTTELPIYGDRPTRPGLYLGLFHGRDEPRQTMKDWGFNGPLIGPLEWVHTTYTCTLQIAFECACDASRYFGTDETEQFLELHGDMLTFGGKFYGDWTVFVVQPDDCGPAVDTFRKSPRVWRHWAHSRCLT
jgi:hypothetical protein